MTSLFKGGLRWPPLLFAGAMLLLACKSTPTQAPQLFGQWFANAQSIGYLNVERMALDLRTDSTYRYYYRNAPIPPNETGDDYTEGGNFRVRGDSLFFTTHEANGNMTTFDYARKYRLLPDTTDWPLRVTYTRRGVDFEIYFQNTK